MKIIVFGLFLAVLLFSGCIQMPTPETINVTEGKTITDVGGVVESVAGGGEQQCEPSYSATLPEKGKMGGQAVVSVTASCAKGKTVSAYLGSTKIAQQTINSDEATVVTLNMPLKSDGTGTLRVDVDGKMIAMGDIEVSPLGSDDTSGTKNNAFSIKEWIANGFEAQGDITVKSIGVYMRRLYSNTLQNSYVIIEVRPDDGNKPGDTVLATTYKPIEQITMNERWIWFNFDDAVELAEGKYWLVFRVDQENKALVSDVANIHYVGEDTTKPAGWNIKKMQLEWDARQEKYLYTSWEPLSYDRAYSILISSQEH